RMQARVDQARSRADRASGAARACTAASRRADPTPAVTLYITRRLRTGKITAVLDGCPIAGSAARVAPERGDLRGQGKDGPGGISRQQGGQSLSCEAPLPAGVTARAPVSRAGVPGMVSRRPGGRVRLLHRVSPHQVVLLRRA